MEPHAERVAGARRSLACALTVCASTAIGPAWATAQRTFVSGSGNDAAACSIAAPCRSFAAAVAQTNSGGEVVVLDSAGYGPVMLTKSVSLIAPPGIYAGIAVFSGDGVTIATPGLKIELRGLAINGQGGDYGINLSAGSDLHVERCTVTGMASDGLSAAGGGAVVVEDSRFTGNGHYGITNAGAYMSVARTTLDRNQNGGFAALPGSGAPANVSMVDTVITMNFGWGLALSGQSNTAVVTADRLTIHGNTYAGVAGDFAAEFVGKRAVIDGNGGDGISITTGALVTLVDTTVRRNGGFGLSVVNGGTRALLDHTQLVDNGSGGVSSAYSGVVQTLHTNAIVNNGGTNVTGALSGVTAQ